MKGHLKDFEEFMFIKSSGIHGAGIFTSVDIPEGSKIMEIKGEIISGDECEKREENDNNVYIFWYDDDTYIDTVNTDKIKFINHNCECNCIVEEDTGISLYLYADRDIKAGEELTIDYGYEDIYEECNCDKCSQVI